MNLQDTSLCLEALSNASRRGVTTAEIVEALNALNKDVKPTPLERSYFCNKCGYMGPTGPDHIRNGTMLPCDYLAAASDWREKAAQDEAAR